jgi:NosR/NirI family nitrous oxide reductase transcriptional regulator
VSGALASHSLPRFIEAVDPQAAFPGADRLGGVTGSPPVAPAFRNNEQIGYVFLNSDFVNATGYSGKPIHVLVAIDMDGVIRNTQLVEHSEPIVLIGIPEKRIVAVLDNYIGQDVGRLVRGMAGDHKVDVVSGATVTVMVIDDTILRGAIKVARTYGLGGLQPERKRSGPKAMVDTEISTVEDWITLIGDGSVRRLKLTIGEANQAFEASGDALATEHPEEGEPDEVFIELYTAVVSIPTIGRSLLGEAEYKNLLERLEPGQQAILLAGEGRYSFKGSSYVRGGIFDRFQIIQGDNSFRFKDSNHKRLRRIAAAGAPDFKDVDVFRIPAGLDFDPAAPWTFELLVGRATGPTKKAFLTFGLDYRTPEKYLKYEETATSAQQSAEPATTSELESGAVPLWQRMWLARIPEIMVLLLALGALTFVFFFQNWLVRHSQLLERFRIAFLVFTLFGIGWYANAQLSVVNILTVFNALVSGFDWGYFLMDPLIFILWGAVAAGLLFWGRGAYCGWLCPFGALQELLNRIAKALRVPQVTLPWGLHERLWALKYIIFLVLFGFSLHSLGWAERLAEVEPFKTAIILKFLREWPFVLFAVSLLIAGLFIERFYCRYLCALGAALAIPGRLRMFAWLRRYKECGSPCQICANECMVQAIHHEGNINVNECLYCLNCQVVYFDDSHCPVMIQKRLKRERNKARVSKERNAQIATLLADIKAQRGKDTGSKDSTGN